MTGPFLNLASFLGSVVAGPDRLAQDIDATKARLTETIAAHDSRDMPEDVWTALADAHHHLTAADAYLRRYEAAREVLDDA